MRLAILAATLLAASPVAAEPPGRTGFELHGDLGVGYAGSRASMNGIAQSVSGVGAAIDVGAGYGSLPGFTFGADLWGTWVYGPIIQTQAPGRSGSLTYRVWGAGPTVRWVHPSGVYAQLTPSVTGVGLSDNDQNGFEWQHGLGLRLSAGKLWVANPRCTLGTALVILYSSNAQREYAAPRWTSIGGGVVVSIGLR
jgi:hypothetical protein